MTKALMPLKAGPLDPDEEADWFAGKRPRRLLAIPFGGPIPSPKSSLGVDLDGEWFSPNTDIFGGYKVLRTNRERLVDWHHSAAPPGPNYGDPTGMMTGHIIGKSILDPDPDEDGWWVDLWLKAGDKRVKLVEALARRGAQLFGSSQPLKAQTDRETGEIKVWPFWLETLSTSPQNTYSVLRPKAALDLAEPTGALRELLSELADLDPTLDRSLRGADAAKAGRELSGANLQAIDDALSELDTGMTRVRELVERVRSKYRKEPTDE